MTELFVRRPRVHRIAAHSTARSAAQPAGTPATRGHRHPWRLASLSALALLLALPLTTMPRPASAADPTPTDKTTDAATDAAGDTPRDTQTPTPASAPADTGAPQAASATDAETASDESVSKPIPDALREPVTQAEFLGRQLYFHDRAAWIATDAMLADKRMRRRKDEIRGWVTEPAADGIRVIFVGEGDAPKRMFEIVVDESDRVSEAVIDGPEPLTERQLAQLRARRLALTQSVDRCASVYNTTAIPAADGGFRVYLSPAFAQHGVYPVGGYHLLRIDAAGEKVLSTRRFTKGCLDITDRVPDEAKRRNKDATPDMMMVTHLLDPQPTEVHVFVSLHARVPLVVMTVDNKLLWFLSRGHVAFYGTIPEKD